MERKTKSRALTQWSCRLESRFLKYRKNYMLEERKGGHILEGGGRADKGERVPLTSGGCGPCLCSPSSGTSYKASTASLIPWAGYTQKLVHPHLALMSFHKYCCLPTRLHTMSICSVIRSPTEPDEHLWLIMMSAFSEFLVSIYGEEGLI